MLGNTERRRNKAERVAGQAWDNLTSAIDMAQSSANSSARTARRRAEHMWSDTSDRLGSGTKEARKRASDAYDALLGRRRRGTSWGWLFGAAAAGLAVGWVATTVGHRALEQSQPLTLPDSLADEFARIR
jgi:hypothetical protein